MKKIIFLLLLFEFQFIYARINYGLLLADNQDGGCNFDYYDQESPESFSKITAPRQGECIGRKLSLRKIYSYPELSNFLLYGCENVVDLLYCRIGNFLIDWNDENRKNGVLDNCICENHFKELLVEFETHRSGHSSVNRKGQNLCIFEQVFEPDSGKICNNLARHKIHKEDAAILSDLYNIVVQPGSGFCNEHWAKIREMIDGPKPKAVVKEPENAGENEANESGDDGYNTINSDDIMDHDSFDPGAISDPDFEPVVIVDSEEEDQKIKNLKTLGESLGVTRIKTQDDYDTLSDREKRNKVSGARKFLSFIFKTMAPNAEKEFAVKVTSIYHEKEKPITPYEDMKDKYAIQYLKTDDKRLRKIILGPMASQCDYAEVLAKIPGLSYFLYRQAQECYKADSLSEDIPKTFKRYDEKKIRTFIEFFTSPHCMVILPYGDMKVRKTNGEKVDIAANIRLQSHAQIIRMYIKMMEEQGREDEVLSRSAMFAILQYCHAQKSKALTCVDYFQAAAFDGFDEVNTVLKSWESKGTINLPQSSDLQLRLKEAQEYLQTDFSINLKSDSSVISYCFQHALSDPNDPEFSAECKTPHFTVSPRCKAFSKILDDLEKLSDELVANCKEENCAELIVLENDNARIQNAVFHIMELKRHIVRSRWSDLEKAKDIANLDNKKAYLTLDWAQKLLKSKYRETQSDYFGKEGMAHHITHVQTIENGVPVNYAFVHIIQENKQDGAAVIAILLDVLLKLKEMGKEEVILRSDNAGCYHSKEVILSIAELIEQSGVKISKYSFSEPQNGKSNSDAIAALVKNKVRAYITEAKKNVQDEYEFFDALVYDPGMPHTSISVSTVNRGTDTKISTMALKGISKFYTFTFQPGGVLVHRAANIGKGKFFKYSGTNIKIKDIPFLEKSKANNVPTDASLWRIGKKKNKSKKTECSHYECPDASCDATFDTHEELMAHIMAGDHYTSTKRLLQKDYAIETYRELVDQMAPIQIDRVARDFADERDEENSINNSPGPPIGWAHRHFQTNPKITEEKRNYVYEKFLEGAKDRSKKWSPKNIAKAMLLATNMNGQRIFAIDEVLKMDQIRSLLSRFAAEQKKPQDGPSKKKQKADCSIRVSNLEGEDDDEIEEECMDQEEQANRNMNLAHRESKYQRDNGMEEIHQVIYEKITDE